MKSFFSKNWQYFTALVLFLALSSMYFLPSIKGYTLKMGDIKNFSGMSKEIKDYKAITGEQALWTGTSFSGMPAYQMGVQYVNPIKNIHNFIGGILTFPVFAIFIALLSFFILAKAFNAGFYIALIGSLGYGFTTYNFLIMEAGHTSKLMAIAYIPGVIAGIIMLYRGERKILSFAILTLFLTLELMVNHIQMTYYFSFIIIAIGIVELINHFKNKLYKEFVIKSSLIICSLLISLMANFGNYYNTYEFVKKTTRGKPVITINAQGKEESTTNQSSGLDRDYIVQWCYGKTETWNLLFPTAKGDRTVSEKIFEELKSNPSTYNYIAENYQKNQGKLFGYYWGDQPFTGGPNYVGAIVIFLALLYLIFVNDSLKWGLLIVSILAILLSWGKNLGGSVENMWLTNFFIDYMPLYSKFRAVSSILVVINLLAPLMGVLFLIHISNNLDWAKKNFKKISIAGIAIVVVLIGIVNSDLIGFSSQFEQAKLTELESVYKNNPKGVNPTNAFMEVEEIRQDIVISDAWRSILFVSLAFALFLLYLKNDKLGKYAFGGIALLILIDLWNVNGRYLNNDKNPQNKREYAQWEKKTTFSNTFSPTPGDLAIYQSEIGQNSKIEQSKADFLATYGKKEKRNKSVQESAMFAALNANTNYRVMDVDNPFNGARVSYFHKTSGGYSPAKLKRYQDMIDFYISKELSYLNTREYNKMKVLNALNTKYYLYQGQLITQNKNANGNAWFVNNVKWVDDSNSEILAIEGADLKNTAIVHKEFKDVINESISNANATIKMDEYTPMHISYQASTPQDGLAVFSEIYYEDGWNAYLDGQLVPHARANYILRTLKIPAGQHKIDFKFEPTMYTVGNTINFIGFVLLFLSFVYFVYNEWKKNKISINSAG